MNNILLWVLNLTIGALIVTPFVVVAGCAWMEYWYRLKADFAIRQAKASAEALKAIAERSKSERAAE